MLKDMWSTTCSLGCVWSHAKRHTGCHQPEADWLLKVEKESKSFRAISRVLESFRGQFSTDSESAPKEGSVQLKVNQMKITSDGKQVNVGRKRERETKWSILTEKASSVQLTILYDCDAEALSR
ncbi:hypothetical protein YC2023_117149 [Brassica napus]